MVGLSRPTFEYLTILISDANELGALKRGQQLLEIWYVIGSFP